MALSLLYKPHYLLCPLHRLIVLGLCYSARVKHLLNVLHRVAFECLLKLVKLLEETIKPRRTVPKLIE